MKKQDSIIINGFENGDLSIKDSWYVITHINYEYFRIKRPAPTFHDLIDVALKVYKDGLLTHVVITKTSIEYWSVNRLPYVLSCHSITGKNHYVSLSGSDAKSRQIIIKKEIDNINSLYTKEFVIESNEDIIELLRNDEIELTNGNVLICLGKAYEVESRWAINAKLKGLTNSEHTDYCLTLLVLKGAKITRKRGEAC